MNEKPLILLVDDEPYNLDYLEQELEDIHCETITAMNGQEALEKVTEHNPDLILLDIMMPVMDGFSVLEKLKVNTEWRDIPVVIISAASDIKNIARGVQMGAEDFLPKPFNEILLHARVNSALEKKRFRDLEKDYTQAMELELSIGHQIQQGFLPLSFPEVEGWVITSFFKPAREVAGDFYDIFELKDGNIAFMLGDVADKGVGSALFMTLYRSLLRAKINENKYLATAIVENDIEAQLINTVNFVNNYVTQSHSSALFATLVIGVLNQATNTIHYVNAGHNPPFFVKKDDTLVDLIPTGPAVGILEKREFKCASVQLAPGESIFFYSDGVPDAKSKDDEFYGEERLRGLLKTNLSNQPGQLCEKLIADLEQFIGDAYQFDDITFLHLGREQ